MPPQTNSESREEIVRAVSNAHAAWQFPDTTNRASIAELLLLFWLGAGRDRLLRRMMDQVSRRWATVLKSGLVAWFCQGAVDADWAKQISMRLTSLGRQPFSAYFESAVTHLVFDARQLKNENPDMDPQIAGEHFASLIILGFVRVVAVNLSTDLLAPFHKNLMPALVRVLRHLWRFSYSTPGAEFVLQAIGTVFAVIEDTLREASGHACLLSLLKHGFLEAIAGLKDWMLTDRVPFVTLDSERITFRHFVVRALLPFLTYRDVAYTTASVF